MDGIKKARERGTRFGRKPLLIADIVQRVRKLRKAGETVPEIMRPDFSVKGVCVSGLVGMMPCLLGPQQRTSLPGCVWSAECQQRK